MSTSNSRYESWLFRTMNDPKLSWARPRAVRRILVVSMVALALSFAGAMWLVPSIWWFAPLMIVFVPLMGSLNGGTRGLNELRQHQLDEREGRVRDAAFRKAFWPMMFVGFVGAFLAMKPGLSPELRAGIGMATFILTMTLPTLYLAWTLPDDIGDES